MNAISETSSNHSGIHSLTHSVSQGARQCHKGIGAAAGAGVGIETVATARTNAARQGEAAADAAEIIVLTQIISLPFGLRKARRGGKQGGG